MSRCHRPPLHDGVRVAGMPSEEDPHRLCGGIGDEAERTFLTLCQRNHHRGRSGCPTRRGQAPATRGGGRSRTWCAMPSGDRSGGAAVSCWPTRRGCVAGQRFPMNTSWIFTSAIDGEEVEDSAGLRTTCGERSRTPYSRCPWTFFNSRSACSQSSQSWPGSPPRCS